MATEQRRVFLLCRRMLRDNDEADGAAQDSFLKAHQAMGRGVEVQDRGKWITRIAVNTCLDRIRSQAWKFWRRRPTAQDERLILDNASAASPSAEDEVFATEIRGRVEAALGKLSARQRAVFVLRHYEQRGVEEIGGMLGLDVGTVKAHMSRALAKMRDELADLYGVRGNHEMLERPGDPGAPIWAGAGQRPPRSLPRMRGAAVARPSPNAVGG
jgi:RNA polymerase sigma-70 factor (ECF subfamily)